MKRLLLLPVLCLMPAAANAESIWLLLSRGQAGFEKIEMRDYWWENGGNRNGAYSMCLRGK